MRLIRSFIALKSESNSVVRDRNISTRSPIWHEGLSSLKRSLHGSSPVKIHLEATLTDEMWITPQLHTKSALGLWTVAEKNEYFELLKVRTFSSKFVDYPYKIILKGYVVIPLSFYNYLRDQASNQYVIAVDTVLENIMKDWNWIQRELLDRTYHEAKQVRDHSNNR